MRIPRTAHFKEDIIQAFYDGIKHKPDTTFGNVKADVLADKDPHFTPRQFLQRHPRLRLARVSRRRPTKSGDRDGRSNAAAVSPGQP